MTALEGIKVLDVASMLAGPYCATLLGDMGADVVKLEPLNGDETRRIGPRKGTESGVFVGVNRNKRSVSVDLRTAEGREVLARLVQWADIVVDNLRPNACKKLGLDHETLSGQNSRIISVSLSTFGSGWALRGTSRYRPGRSGIERVHGGHRFQ